MNNFIINNKADLIGWVGSFFFIIGATLLAYQFIWGFVSNFLGNTCFIIQGGWSKLPSLYILSAVLALLNVFGIYKWIF